jgi:hypothetical protein
LILRRGYGYQIDIWGLGIILYAMAVGKMPFLHEDVHTLLGMIISQPVDIPAHISAPLRDLLEKLLRKNPNERIRLNGIKEHPWVKAEGSPKPFEQLKTCGFLDREVLLTMQELGIDCAGLSDDLEGEKRNHATTIYRILRRRTVVDELAALQPPLRGHEEVTPAAIPQMLSSGELPIRKVLRTVASERRASVEGRRRMLCVQSRMCVVRAADTVKTARKLKYTGAVPFATAIPGALGRLA